MAFKDLSEALTGFDFDNVVVFDTETTGTEPYLGDEVVSISICDAYGNDLFSSLIKPRKKKAWPEAEAINGISPAMVKDAPYLDDAADDIRRLLCTGKLVVGYNVLFDIEFLREAGVVTSYLEAFDVMQEYAEVHGAQRSRYSGRYQYSRLSACALSYGYSFLAHDSKEDAKATAYCFRALLSDEAYVNKKLTDLKGELTRQELSQTKATTESIEKLIAEGVVSSKEAVLKTGAVTRGKNKGAARYECFVGDQCVGVGHHGDRQHVANLLFTSVDDLPEKVKCSVVLSKSGSSAYCECTITEGTVVFGRRMREMAEAYRESNGCEWRQVEAPRQPDPAADSYQAADAAPAEPEGIAPVANKAGLKAALLIAFIFVDLMLLLVNVPLAVFFGVVAFFVWRAKR